MAQDRTPGADQDPAAALDARQRVRALVAPERVGGPKVTAAEVIAVTGRSRRRAYDRSLTTIEASPCPVPSS